MKLVLLSAATRRDTFSVQSWFIPLGVTFIHFKSLSVFGGRIYLPYGDERIPRVRDLKSHGRHGRKRHDTSGGEQSTLRSLHANQSVRCAISPEIQQAVVCWFCRLT